MARYLWINGVQSTPFPVGEDETRRPLLSCNYEGRAYNIVSLELDLISILGPSLTVDGVDTFYGPVGSPPAEGDGPFINIVNTGGVPAARTHNGSAYPNFSFQIVVRATTFEAAEARAKAIHAVLDGAYNLTT